MEALVRELASIKKPFYSVYFFIVTDIYIESESQPNKYRHTGTDSILYLIYSVIFHLLSLIPPHRSNPS